MALPPPTSNAAGLRLAPTASCRTTLCCTPRLATSMWACGTRQQAGCACTQRGTAAASRWWPHTAPRQTCLPRVRVYLNEPGTAHGCTRAFAAGGTLLLTSTSPPHCRRARRRHPAVGPAHANSLVGQPAPHAAGASWPHRHHSASRGRERQRQHTRQWQQGSTRRHECWPRRQRAAQRDQPAVPASRRPHPRQQQ